MVGRTIYEKAALWHATNRITRGLKQGVGFLCFLLPLSVAAKDVSLEAVLQSASQHALSLQSKQSEIGIETARLETVKSEYYPILSLSYNNEYNRDLRNNLGGVESVGDTVITNGTRYQTSLSANLNYELYHFGMTQRKVNAASKEVAVKRWQWCEEESRLHREILEHYANALKADVSLNEQRTMLEIRRKIYAQKKRLREAGQVSMLEVGEEAMAVLSLEHDVEQASLRYDDEIVTLERISHLEITGEDMLLPLSVNKKRRSVNLLFEQTAVGARIEEQLLEKHEEILMLDRSRLPSIVFYANYYFYGSDPTDLGNANEGIRGSSWKAGVGIRWTLFEGFKFDSEMQRLKLEMQKLKYDRDGLKRDYEYERRTRMARIEHYGQLQQKEEKVFKQTGDHVEMAKRLREQSEIKSIDELSIELDNVRQYLTLQTEAIESAYEMALLEIMNKGADECSLP